VLVPLGGKKKARLGSEEEKVRQRRRLRVNGADELTGKRRTGRGRSNMLTSQGKVGCLGWVGRFEGAATCFRGLSWTVEKKKIGERGPFVGRSSSSLGRGGKDFQRRRVQTKKFPGV